MTTDDSDKPRWNKSDPDWNIAKSMSTLKITLGADERTEDDMYSTDITQPTCESHVADLASGIARVHSENVANVTKSLGRGNK